MGKTVVRNATVLSMDCAIEERLDANLIVVSTPSLKMLPINNPAGAAVENAYIGNIDSRFVSAVKLNTKLVDIDINPACRRRERTVGAIFAGRVERDGNWPPKPYFGGTEAKVGNRA
jgi:hypothetical protein